MINYITDDGKSKFDPFLCDLGVLRFVCLGENFQIMTKKREKPKKIGNILQY